MASAVAGNASVAWRKSIPPAVSAAGLAIDATGFDKALTGNQHSTNRTADACRGLTSTHSLKTSRTRKRDETDAEKTLRQQGPHTRCMHDPRPLLGEPDADREADAGRGWTQNLVG